MPEPNYLMTTDLAPSVPPHFWTLTSHSPHTRVACIPQAQGPAVAGRRSRHQASAFHFPRQSLNCLCPPHFNQRTGRGVSHAASASSSGGGMVIRSVPASARISSSGSSPVELRQEAGMQMVVWPCFRK